MNIINENISIIEEKIIKRMYSDPEIELELARAIEMAIRKQITVKPIIENREKQIIINANEKQNRIMYMYRHLSRIENKGHFSPPNDIIYRTWLPINNDLRCLLSGRSTKSNIY